MADIPSLEAPSWMRASTGSSLSQAHKPSAGFIEGARRVTGTMQDSTEFAPIQSRDMFARGLDSAESKVCASFDLARKLAEARPAPEAAQFQAEFAGQRSAAMQARAQDLNGLAEGTFRQGTERAHPPMQPGADAARKAAQQGRDAALHAGREIQQATEQLSH
ncbi:phasin family protein [Methylobacterium sp. J-030]|uniref:phasin family protein n=1 Tax=Methylobacterium sp. J-030 TaxID=2836627 RepID=UPI001FBB2526|nr:phasin family protein [Methylobacterium sp. J-030]MCJ2069925.1 phasin family protein [Methylobacterium sp. J-030]